MRSQESACVYEKQGAFTINTTSIEIFFSFGGFFRGILLKMYLRATQVSERQHMYTKSKGFFIIIQSY